MNELVVVSIIAVVVVVLATVIATDQENSRRAANAEYHKRLLEFETSRWESHD